MRRFWFLYISAQALPCYCFKSANLDLLRCCSVTWVSLKNFFSFW